MTVDIDSLLGSLTLQEKIQLLAGANWWETAAIPRLEIPSLKFSDGPNGARGSKMNAGVKAACFPASVSLAATFDRGLVGRIGEALAGEAKTKGASVLLGPTICLHRDPRGGRNFEAFSEDPFLTGEMASSYITGLQSKGVGATVKHFALNEEETFRYTMDVLIDERTMRELYLRPFEMAVKNARPWAAMTSYGLINGTHADSHKWLLDDVLRQQWGFQGLVMSDWGGTNSCAGSIEAGLDLEMPGPGIERSPERVAAAVKEGLSEKTIDLRARAVLELLQVAGKFEHPETPDEEAIDRPENRQLIRQASAEGMVLLKNADGILPLVPGRDGIKSIAMLGLAKEYLGHGGGSAKVNSIRKITAFEGFEEALRGKDVRLDYQEGASVVRSLPPLSTEISDDDGHAGLTLNVTNRGDIPPQRLNTPTAYFVSREFRDATSVSLTGTFKPSTSGKHYIDFSTTGNSEVFIDDEKVFSFEGTSDIMAFMLGTAKGEKKRYDFVRGQEYKIRVQARVAQDARSGNTILDKGVIGVSFGFMTEQAHDEALLDPAIAAAKNADVAIVFTGHTPTWETEGSDRETMDLPRDGSLDTLIHEVAKVNPRTIVVNSTGSPISMPWLADVKAVLQTWFPGQEAGHSIADVVFGAVCPGGKLPVTFPNNIEHTPTAGNFPGDLVRREVRYEEGLFMGYRWYDENPEAALFPFGFGLSYATFAVNNIRADQADLNDGDELTVTIDVTNTGSVSGSEVVQVYAGPIEPSIRRPRKELVGFEKVTLEPAEEKSITVAISPRCVAYWNQEKGGWSVDAGPYGLYIGTSSVDIAQTIDFRVSGSFHFAP